MEQFALTETTVAAQAGLAGQKEQLTIVIPTLNEEGSIGALIDEVKNQGFEKIMVADGYSHDGTARIARERGADVVMQHGQGKAGAMVTAFRAVPTRYLVVIDGDGSYDPADIRRFVPLIGEYDLVKGIRARNENMSGLHKFGNSIITKTFDLLFGTSIGDVCSGMYMLKTEKVKSLHLEKHPFTVEQEIAAELVVTSSRMTTVPIGYRKRTGGVSKVNTWRQGFRDLLTNFELARTHNPIMLFSVTASLFLIPSLGILAYALLLAVGLDQYHSGYFLTGLILLVLGAQGLTVATIGVMLRRIERRITTADV